MDYKTKTNLILPFSGTLFVSNGGRDPQLNSHIRPPDQGPQNQLYAYDFRTQNTETLKKLEDFPVFGTQILAPGDGIVVQVIDGSIDVEIGQRDRSVGVGNAIIIDHHNREYSLICHFKHKSIRVKVGDIVKQADVIGLCGNTGNTFQPHIHFNLQDDPLMHIANGLPAQFRNIIVNGQPKSNYEPVRGDLVSNSPS